MTVRSTADTNREIRAHRRVRAMLIRSPRHWPRLMRAQTAAEYTDEKSVKSFLRRAGTIYPKPIHVRGRGRLWTKESLDEAIDRLTTKSLPSGNLADDL